MTTATTTTAKRARRPRGFSLLEILVVLSIIALLTGVAAIAVMRHLDHARRATTEQSARTLRTAIQTYKMDHPGGECPSIDDLVKDEAIDTASRRTDAWEQKFVIQCDDRGNIVVASAGPDKKLGTEDDIKVPDPSKT